jgi:hypothetical protein
MLWLLLTDRDSHGDIWQLGILISKLMCAVAFWSRNLITIWTRIQPQDLLI